MKSLKIIFVFIVLVILSSSCSSDKQAPHTEDNADWGAKITAETTKKDEKTQQIKQQVSDYIAEFYEEERIAKISLSDTKIEVRVKMDISSKDAAPDDWTDIVEKAEMVCGGIIDAMPDGERRNNGILYLIDSDGNNLLSVLNGKSSYSAFKQYSYEGENAPTISLEEFNAIKTGMTYQEVFDIIGSRGQKISESDLGLGDDYYTAMYQWDGEGSIGANANVTFQGGKVISKAQFGLE